MKLVSPDELMEAAKEQMLDGREPTTEEDWVKVVNFLAFNIYPETAEPAMKILVAIYNIPLSADFVKQIVEFQAAAHG